MPGLWIIFGLIFHISHQISQNLNKFLDQIRDPAHCRALYLRIAFGNLICGGCLVDQIAIAESLLSVCLRNSWRRSCRIWESPRHARRTLMTIRLRLCRILRLRLFKDPVRV
ncbi:hypothetical protein SUGI_0047510 [Cryptomeria japonica]|nr:hypothetical protein SUGI_0047510 [Cryptomeria japonica]